MNTIPLCETDSYVLFQEHEDVFLFDKDMNEEVWRTDLYGNSACGLIGISNEWVVAGGENLIVWINNKLKIVEDVDLKWIVDMRQVAKDEIHILTDPWKEGS